MAREFTRHVFLWLFIAITALLVTSSGALATTADEYEYGFEGTDGSPPDPGKWELIDVDGDDRVQLYNGTLEVFGEAWARTKETFHTEEFLVDVDVATSNLSGQSIDIIVGAGEFDNPEVFIDVSYNSTDGWTVLYMSGEDAHLEESNVTNVEVDVWYRVIVKVEKKEFNITVLYKENQTAVWHYSNETNLFEHESWVALGVHGSEAHYDALRIESLEKTWRDEKNTNVTIALFIIFFIVLFGPFLIKKIEHELEAFLFVMGVAAVTVCTLFLEGVDPGGHGHEMEPVWGGALVRAGLLDPIMITMAVLIAGLVFHYGRDKFKEIIELALQKMELHIFVFVVVFILGMVASIITAIISALLLVEVITVLKLDRKTETDLTILACFSIGLGAALTPIGEPLSTIVIVTKLQAEFTYLLFAIGKYVIPSIIAISAFSMYYISRARIDTDTLSERKEEEDLKAVPIRAFKVYLFVMALVFLGTGFAPLIEWYIKHLDATVLFWVNMSSAILDNATLASAEIVKTMTQAQINAAVMALLFSGGMLIPGNIPNIIAANKLKITSKEWARFGVPFGLFWMCVFFVILFVLKL